MGCVEERDQNDDETVGYTVASETDLDDALYCAQLQRMLLYIAEQFTTVVILYFVTGTGYPDLYGSKIVHYLFSDPRN